jgi:hypothetical protein
MACASQSGQAQTTPLLHLSPVAADSWSVQWTSEVDTSYQLLFTENIDYFSLWTAVGDSVVATNTTMGLTVSTTTPTGFFQGARLEPIRRIADRVHRLAGERRDRQRCNCGCGGSARR